MPEKCLVFIQFDTQRGKALSRLAKISIVVAVLVLGSVAAVMAIWRPWAHLEHGQLIDIDLDRPDALISSAHLSRLPADMLKVPMLRDVLTEDFVFYYAHTDTGMSVDGAIRRIAFEHDLRVSDRLFASMLDEPADLGLWRAQDGKLRYWVLTIRRNALTKVLDGLAKVAATDSQLRIAGELSLSSGKATLYVLHLNAERSLLFAAAGDRMVVLSDAGLLFGERKAPAAPKAAASAPVNEYGMELPQAPVMQAPDTFSGLNRDRAKKIAALLDGKPADNFLAKRFQFEETPTAGHRIALSARFLSFGYQPFFPGMEALGFNYDGKSWSSQALADGKALGSDFASVWQAMPGQAAACIALPMDWKAIQTVLDKGVGSAQKLDLSTVTNTLDGPAGMCWYAKSRLATPLFVARFKSPDMARQALPTLSKVFEAAVGAYEYNHNGGAFPVESHKLNNGVVLRRVVSSPFGTDKAAGSKIGDQLSAGRYFTVSLAVFGNVVAFSPDAKLAEDAVAVAAKRFPAAADGLSQQGNRTLFRASPAKLAQLLKTEAMGVLPKDEEPIFSGVAQAQLLPKFEALGHYPDVVVSLPAGRAEQMRWQPLQWQYEGK